MSYNDPERDRILQADQRWMEEKRKIRLDEVADKDFKSQPKEPPTLPIKEPKSWHEVERMIESEEQYNWRIFEDARKRK